MKKVLVISYAFPPVGGGGIQRVLKFVKYLPEFNWKPIVLSVSNPSVPVEEAYTPLSISPELKVLRAFSFEPGYKIKQKAWGQIDSPANAPNSILKIIKKTIKGFLHFILIPDPQVAWIPCAVIKGLKAVHKEKIDVVFVSGPPFSSFIIGYLISRIMRIPWIADFRDEWVPFYTKAYDFHTRNIGRRIVEYLEKKVFESADEIVTATSSITDNYKKLYPLHSKKISTITNGFDLDDFSSSSARDGSMGSNKINMVYTGTVFGVTTARYFLEALEEVIKQKPNLKNSVKVTFAGRIVDKEQSYFETLISNDIVDYIGYIPHEDCMGIIQNADLLLIFLNNIPGSERILTGKIFEYIAVKKTILAVIPDGELSKLLDELGIAYIVHPDDSSAIQSAIVRAIDDWNTGRSFHRDNYDTLISKFDRKNLTEKLSKILNSVNKC